MEILKEAVMKWLKEILTFAVSSNISGLYESVNSEVIRASEIIGEDPKTWNTSIYSLVKTVSDNVMVPIAGMVLTFVMCIELIRMVTERNAFSGEGDTFMFFKWIMKSAVAVTIVSNTWNIIMSIFEIGGNIVNRVSGQVSGGLTYDTGQLVSRINSMCSNMEVGELLSVWISTGMANVFIYVVAGAILIASFSRMIEIYLYTSAAPIPFAMLMGKETNGIGTNYLRNLLALGFQGFLMMLCIGIYGALVAGITQSSDPIKSVWISIAYGCLLTFALFRTSSLSKSIFNSR